MAPSLLIKPCIRIEFTFGHTARDEGAALNRTAVLVPYFTGVFHIIQGVTFIMSMNTVTVAGCDRISRLSRR